MIDDLPLFIDGDGPDTIVMLHGWPDTHDIWAQQVEHFKHSHRCVRFTLPGFDDPHTLGYTLSEITARILQVVDAIRPCGKVILMLHDWGCLFGFHFAALHGERVERIIAIDVGDVTSRDFQRGLSLRHKLMIFAYQMPLALSWYLKGAPGHSLARAIARFLRCKADAQRIHAGMSYPYAMRWMGALGGLDQLAEPARLQCPIFYAYGRYKPFQFQSGQWLQRIEADPRSRVLAFKASHWVMVDCAESFNSQVAEWLAA